MKRFRINGYSNDLADRVKARENKQFFLKIVEKQVAPAA